MRSMLGLVLGCLMLWGTAAVEAQNRSSAKSRDHQAAVDHLEIQGEIHVVFSTHDLHVIRDYYAAKHHRLPPGLRKKLARTGTLPPGWQKKLQPFPAALERELVVLPDGLARGVIEGRAVIYNPDTHVIIDVAVVF